MAVVTGGYVLRLLSRSWTMNAAKECENKLTEKMRKHLPFLIFEWKSSLNFAMFEDDLYYTLK